jgi:uncharacterized protein YjiS (DUF1127 family)
MVEKRCFAGNCDELLLIRSSTNGLEHKMTNGPAQPRHRIADRPASSSAWSRENNSSHARRGWIATLLVWMARSQKRRALQELARGNDRLLKDIGLTHDQIRSESAKPFWRD